MIERVTTGEACFKTGLLTIYMIDRRALQHAGHPAPRGMASLLILTISMHKTAETVKRSPE